MRTYSRYYNHTTHNKLITNLVLSVYPKCGSMQGVFVNYFYRTRYNTKVYAKRYKTATALSRACAILIQQPPTLIDLRIGRGWLYLQTRLTNYVKEETSVEEDIEAIKDGQFFTPSQVAELLGVSTSAIRKWRQHPATKNKLPFVQFNQRVFRYMGKDVKEFIRKSHITEEI